MPTSSSAAYGSYKPQPAPPRPKKPMPEQVTVDLNQVSEVASSETMPSKPNGFCASTLCKLLTGFLIVILCATIVVLVLLLIRSETGLFGSESSESSGATGSIAIPVSLSSSTVPGSLTSGVSASTVPSVSNTSSIGMTLSGGVSSTLTTTTASSTSNAISSTTSTTTTTTTTSTTRTTTTSTTSTTSTTTTSTSTMVNTTTTFSTVMPVICPQWNWNSIVVAGNYSAGGSAGLLNGTWDFSIDAYSNLYVSDGTNNRIQKFVNGSLVGITLTSGFGNGLSQVSNPSASYIDTYGHLYVSDMFNYRVMKYSNITWRSAITPIVGQVVAGGSWGMSYNQIQISWGVVADLQGNVYVSDYGNNRVMKWTLGSSVGILVAGIGNGTAGNGSNQLSLPQGIHINQNLTLFIADSGNNRVQKCFAGSLTCITVAGANGQILYPTDVFVDNNGILYVLSGGALYQFYPGSSVGVLLIWLPGFGFGFKFDSIGNLYYADYADSVIRKYLLNSSSCGNTTGTSSMTLSTTISTTNSSSSLPFYGVQLNMTPSVLPMSWNQCHSSAYAVALNGSYLTFILNACNKTKLLLGCRPMNSTILTVAAVGLRSDVLYNCSTLSSCTNVANGVGWYYSNNWSWGFTNGSDTVARSSCDSLTNTPTRLCWHTGQAGGGYRCGASTGLNSDLTTERVIYHSD